MNYIDILLIMVVLFAMWSGYQYGFINGSLQLIRSLGSLAAAFFLYKYANEVLLKLFPKLGDYSMPLAFILVWILASVVLRAIVNPLLRNLSPSVRTGADKAMGIAPGLINGLISALILSALLLALPLSDGITNETRNSKIAAKFSPAIDWLGDALTPVFDPAINQTLHRLTVEPGSEESVKLNFTDLHPKPRPDLEVKMLELVNEERLKNGLTALQADPELTAVARAYSKEMLARGFFSHYTPEGTNPFDRMKAAGIKFRAAGENLALAPTLNIAHNGLMNSPGHRAKILNKNFGRCGIGIMDADMHGLMVSQEFRN